MKKIAILLSLLSVFIFTSICNVVFAEQNAKEAIQNTVNSASNVMKNTVDAAKNTANDATNSMENAAGSIKNEAQPATDAVKNTVNEAVNTGENVANEMKNTAQNTANAMQDNNVQNNIWPWILVATAVILVIIIFWSTMTRNRKNMD